jgi:hypothetical protein
MKAEKKAAVLKAARRLGGEVKPPEFPGLIYAKLEECLIKLRALYRSFVAAARLVNELHLSGEDLRHVYAQQQMLGNMRDKLRLLESIDQADPKLTELVTGLGISRRRFWAICERLDVLEGKKLNRPGVLSPSAIHVFNMHRVTDPEIGEIATAYAASAVLERMLSGPQKWKR